MVELELEMEFEVVVEKYVKDELHTVLLRIGGSVNERSVRQILEPLIVQINHQIPDSSSEQKRIRDCLDNVSLTVEEYGQIRLSRQVAEIIIYDFVDLVIKSP